MGSHFPTPRSPMGVTLSRAQRAQFTDFTAPLDDRTLARFYTLSDTELELIRRRHRRGSTQLGFAVQLGYARLPGRVLRVDRIRRRSASSPRRWASM
jgi:Domain of unknown function (DUF4158)